MGNEDKKVDNRCFSITHSNQIDVCKRVQPPSNELLIRSQIPSLRLVNFYSAVICIKVSFNIVEHLPVTS